MEEIKSEKIKLGKDNEKERKEEKWSGVRLEWKCVFLCVCHRVNVCVCVSCFVFLSKRKKEEHRRKENAGSRH